MYLENNILVLDGDFNSFIQDIETSFQTTIVLSKERQNYSTLGEIITEILNQFSFSPQRANIERKAFDLLKANIETLFGHTIKRNATIHQALAPTPEKNWKKLEKQMQLMFPPRLLGTLEGFVCTLVWYLSSFGRPILGYFLFMELKEYPIWQQLPSFFQILVGGILVFLSLFRWKSIHEFATKETEKLLANELPVSTIQGLVEELCERNYGKISQGYYSKEDVEGFLITKLAKYAKINEQRITYQLTLDFITTKPED